MAQFKVYQSTDFGSPVLRAESGSLVSLLDSVLVNGYGTGSYFKSGSGWSKPFINWKNAGGIDVIGCWKQPSGSKFTLVVNDAAIIGTAAASSGGVREGFACGWVSLFDLTGSNVQSAVMGSGSGQFPLPSQAYTSTLPGPSGSIVWRKSADITSSIARTWQMYVDDRTFYLVVNTLDVYSVGTPVYDLYTFGDIYSFSSNDSLKCIIMGRIACGSAGATGNRSLADIVQCVTVVPTSITNEAHLFIAGGQGGTHASSLPLVKFGDMSKTGMIGWAPPSGGLATAGMTPSVGVLPCPNPTDGCVYLSAFSLAETTGNIRGRMRGLYWPCHLLTSFSDGVIVYGGNELTGKVFRTIKRGGNNGMWLIEISNTLDTNIS